MLKTKYKSGGSRVTKRRDGGRLKVLAKVNRMALFGGVEDVIEWEYEWWQGQPKEQIRIIGFKPIDEITPMYTI